MNKKYFCLNCKTWLKNKEILKHNTPKNSFSCCKFCGKNNIVKFESSEFKSAVLSKFLKGVGIDTLTKLFDIDKKSIEKIIRNYTIALEWYYLKKWEKRL